jgi:hypothetical protein
MLAPPFRQKERSMHRIVRFILGAVVLAGPLAVLAEGGTELAPALEATSAETQTADPAKPAKPTVEYVESRGVVTSGATV